MSFDIFVMCARKGARATFKRELFEEIMGRGAVDASLPLTNIDYVDGMCVAYYDEEKEDLDSAAFDHFGGDTFWSRLYEFADRTGSFLVWPDVGRQVAVTRPEMIGEIYPDVAEKLGPPYVVKDGTQLKLLVLAGVDPAAQ
ncbi:MAG TPA: hypothetical protein VMD53_07330 [Rhizomicrobium sp.]|nr:hypothetical protein [Rhizomicrobium sp.]